MRRKRLTAVLVVSLFIAITMIGTSPMPFFVMIEGGGGGGGGGPSLPYSKYVGLLVSSPGSWDITTKTAYAQYETEVAVVHIQVSVTYYSKYYNKAYIKITTQYSWKDDRTTSPYNNDGSLMGMRIEVKPFTSYQNDIKFTWETGTSDMGACPSVFTGYANPTWGSLVEAGTHYAIQVLLDELIATGTVFWEVAIPAAIVGLIMWGMEATSQNIPDNIEYGSSDLYGDAFWENPDSTQLVDYGGEVGLQYAYDFSSYNEARMYYKSSIPTGQLLGLKFRACAYYNDISAPGWIRNINTPWTYIYFMA